MTEHTPQTTPGPWRYEGNGWVAVDDPDNQDRSGHCVPICRVRGAQTHQIDHNGHLITAAPDMLEALENIENDAEHMPNSAWKMIQTAIAKAHNQ